MESHASSSNAAPETAECEQCGKTVPARSLLRHTNKHQERLIVCAYPGCNKKFVNANGVRRHGVMHSLADSIVPSSLPKTHRQETAPISNSDAHDWELGPPARCGLCGIASSQIPLLADHQKSSHAAVKLIACTRPKCGRVFSNVPNLRLHESMHAKQEMHACLHPECGAIFKTQVLLQNHEKCHGPETVSHSPSPISAPLDPSSIPPSAPLDPSSIPPSAPLDPSSIPPPAPLDPSSIPPPAPLDPSQFPFPFPFGYWPPQAPFSANQPPFQYPLPFNYFPQQTPPKV